MLIKYKTNVTNVMSFFITIVLFVATYCTVLIL